MAVQRYYVISQGHTAHKGESRDSNTDYKPGSTLSTTAQASLFEGHLVPERPFGFRKGPRSARIAGKPASGSSALAPRI